MLLQPLNGVYTAAVHYKKDIQNGKEPSQSLDVFILFNLEIDPDVDSDRTCEIDQEQNCILLRTLNNAVTKNKSKLNYTDSAFIIDCARPEVRMAAKAFGKYSHKHDKSNLQIGAHTFQALFGMRQKGKFSFINYLYSDYSDTAFLCVLRSFEIIEQYLKSCKSKLNVNSFSLFYSLPNQDKGKNKLILCFEDYIKKSLKDHIPDATLGQLKLEFEKIKKIKGENRIFEDIWGEHFTMLAYKFFESPYYSDDMQVRDFIWKTFAEEPLDKLQSATNSWVYPLQKFLALRGLESTIAEALTQYKTIIVSCNKNKLVALHNFFCNRQFYIEASSDAKGPLNSIDFSNFIDSYILKSASK